jgi:hypothetical protein
MLSREEQGEILWLGREYCDGILRTIEGPPVHWRPRLLGMAPPPWRKISSFIECLLAKSQRVPQVRNLLAELVRQHPEIVQSLRNSTTASSGIGEETTGTDPATFLHEAVQRAPDRLDTIQLFATPELAVVPSPNGWVPLHGSDLLSEDAALFLLDLNPNAAAVMDQSGRLPIHRYVERHSCWPVVERFVEAHPDALSIPDPATGLCPMAKILQTFNFAFRDIEPLNPNRYNNTSLADMVTALARMIREHKPAALADPSLRVPGLFSHEASRFESPLLYVCRNCPDVELLVPLVEMCPISLVCEWQVRVTPEEDDPMDEEGDDEDVNDDLDADLDDGLVVPGPDGEGGDIRNDVEVQGAQAGANGGPGDGMGGLQNAAPQMDEDNNNDEGEEEAEGAWRTNGIPLEVVKMFPNVSNAAVDCLDRATSDMCLALMEALLASFLRQEVLERIGSHCPDYDAEWKPLTELFEKSRDQGTYVELRADLIGAPSVQALLRDSPAFRDCATGLYRMNLHPDVQCFAPIAAPNDLVSRADPRDEASPYPLRILIALEGCSNGNLDCIYIKLRSCPPAAWPWWAPA